MITLILNSYISNMSNLQKANELKNQGNEAFKAKKYEEAIDLFSQAIELNPADHVFYSNRSQAYLNSGNHDKALEDAETCVKINPVWPRGYQRKGTALFYLDKVDEAIQTYQEGLKLEPNNKGLLDDLKAAQNKKKEGDMPDMMNKDYLSAMLKLMSNPETKDFINDPEFMKKVQICMKNPQMAQMMMQSDPKIKKAVEVIATSTAPTDMEGLRKLFEGQDFSFKQTGKHSAPAPPGFEKHEHQHNENCSHDHAEHSKPQPKKQEKPKYEKMEEQNPAEDAKNKGNQLFKKKQFNDALNYYEEAIKINPNEPLYYNNKAAAYIELKEYDNALSEIAKAEKLFEEGVAKDYIKKAKVLARKATILQKQQKYDEAIEAYDKSLIEDHQQKVKDQLIKLKKLKKQQQALAYINPELAQKHNEEGTALYKDGKFPQALKEYEEAIRRNPNVAKYYSNLGTVYIKLMEFQRAKDNFDQALKIDPNYTKAYPKKGDCHFFLKEYHKALQAYEDGLKKDPENELCKLGLTKTQQAIYMSNSQEDQEQRAKRAMADPEIQAIMATPEVRNALAELERNPKAAQHILSDKNLAPKFQKLIAAGVLRIG